MKKILLILTTISVCTFADSGLSAARELAQQGIIVNQSSMAQAYRINTSLDIQESSMYRLSDAVIRQEVLGTALKLKSISLPDSYICRNYFYDISEWWVCRAAELAADYDIITRANLSFRPHDQLTLAEALGITLKALDISLSTTPTASISGSLPAWQKRLILTIQEKQISMDVRDESGSSIAFYDTRIGDASGFEMSHTLTRGQFFQLVLALLNYSESQNPLAYCTVYNDGCNDCTSNMEVTQCTERQCFWKGIPSCSACEDGYMLKDNRCIKKPTACVGLGGVVSNFSLPPEYQTSGTCCAGLTSVGSKESGIVGAPNICANIGDGYCDANYESTHNSSDCPITVFDNSLCQSYYDGCNNCNNVDGTTACTLRYCFTNGPAYCTSYVSYTPVNQSQDLAFLAKIKKEMVSYTSDQSCTDNDQCNWKLFGSNSCGGWNSVIAYSSKNIDVTLLSNKATYYTQTEQQYNQNYGITGTCVYLQSPHPRGCSASGFCTP